MERAERAGFKTSRLMYNWRSFGGIEKFASRLFYEGQMLPGHNDRMTPEAKIARQWLHSLMPPSTTVFGSLIVLLDTEGSYEYEYGTSYGNRANAHLALELARQAERFGVCAKVPTAKEEGRRATVLIITPYLTQLALYEAELAKHARCKYFDIRLCTPENAHGKTVDVCIYDMVRSSKIGHTARPDYLNVATTRA